MSCPSKEQDIAIPGVYRTVIFTPFGRAGKKSTMGHYIALDDCSVNV
jgi:hypothetical protein